nr:10405_t:CDS:2 [Entrophospora candida]
MYYFMVIIPSNIEFINDGSFGTISHAPLKKFSRIQKYTFEQPLNETKQHCKAKLHNPKYLDNAENYSCNEKSILECFYEKFQVFIHTPFEDKSIKFNDIMHGIISEKHETIIKTPRKYAEIYIVMQDLDNITNTIEDVDNLTDQTNNESQGDGLLNSTELSFSMQANDI